MSTKLVVDLALPVGQGLLEKVNPWVAEQVTVLVMDS